MKTCKLISNILSVKKELLNSQFVFSCKSYEQGQKGKDLPSTRAVGRELPLTSYFSASDIRFQYIFLTGRLQAPHEGDKLSSHLFPVIQ